MKSNISCDTALGRHVLIHLRCGTFMPLYLGCSKTAQTLYKQKFLCIISTLQNISQSTNITQIIKSDMDQMERRNIDL